MTESDSGAPAGRRRRARTIRAKPLSREERDALREQFEQLEVARPRTRRDCRNGIRPCPFVSCKYHLYLDVNPRNGHIKFNFPDQEVWEIEETCALDVAEREQGITLEEVGRFMNLTRERVRQVEVSGLTKIQETDALPGDFDELELFTD
ncbi:MAG: sigma factor-like helix-turn-helix DNA-binding protein [Myxococcota bacterium]|nr:sigma factor-like helix-turn-helix DNA-binding protein [Myxococcota bacterium]